MSGDARELLSSPLARALFAGQYKEILRATIDSAEGKHPPGDTPLVIGALVFSGRQEEAIAVHRWYAREHGDDRDVRVASLFFLSVGECRSGRYQAAIAHCREAVRAAQSSDPLQGFFLHQAIGLLRHFTGRMSSAARHASLARQRATEARFSYGRMLALDLLGHSVATKGDVHAGVTLLEQSAELAEALGLLENAGAPRTGAIVHRARYGVSVTNPRKELTDYVDTLRPEDSYARRMVLSELAIQHALAGAGDAASTTIDAASRIALPDGDRRARIRRLIAEGVVAGLGQGHEAARAKFDTAAAHLDAELDDALEVELLWGRAVASGLDVFDADDAARARVAVLATRTGIARARFLAARREERRHLDSLAEDKLASLLEAVQRGPDEARHRLTSEGSWGLLPFAYGQTPARRIHLLHDFALLILEEKGNVVPLEMPGAVLVSLLCAIAAGPVSKEDLVRRVWRMKVYRSERHDALVHTAASRLRNALGSWASWIRITDQGYALADGVEIHEDRADPETVGSMPPGPLPSERPPPPRPSEPPSWSPSVETKPRSATEERRDAVLAALAQEPLSTSEIAAKLKTSEMTAFRVLTTLASEGLVERTGQGKRTRYRLPASA